MYPLFAISTSSLLLIISSLVGGVGVPILTIILYFHNRRRNRTEEKDAKLIASEEQQRKNYVDEQNRIVVTKLKTLATEQHRQEKDITANHELLHKRVTELRHAITAIKENCIRHAQTFQQQETARLNDELRRIADRLEHVSDTTVKNETYRHDSDMVSKNYEALGQAITDLATLVERLRSKGDL